MKSTGRDLLRRTGVVLAGMLLAGSMVSGTALAGISVDPGGSSDDGGTSNTVGGLPGALSLDGSSDDDTGDGTSAGGAADALSQVADAVADAVSQVADAVTDAATTNTTTSTTPTGPSGSNTVVIYSPYPVPVFGDYGKRFYGKYYDHGCGCDRYAAPTYVPQVVNATQVSSVPKGGVDTGDGSFP